MRDRNAQVSIFIALGIIILVIGGVSIYLLSQDNNLQTDEIQGLALDKGSIRLLVEECVEEVAVPGIFILSKQGGFIYDYPKKLSTENGDVAYHLDSNEMTGPQTSFMEQELSRFIEESINLCLTDMENFSELNLTFEKPSAESVISKNKVTIKLDYPITLYSGKDRMTTSAYRKELPLELGHLISVKEEIISNILSDPGILDPESLSETYANVNILPQDSDTLVYSITEKESGADSPLLTFNIAVKKNIVENIPPSISEIGYREAYVGEQFTLDVQVYDPDSEDIDFNDDTALFDIDDDGMVRFIPSPKDSGDYEMTIFASDGINEVAELFNLSITKR